MDNTAQVSEAVLLKLSACADVAQISGILAQTPLDPLTIIANAPECVDVIDLADLLSKLAGLQGTKNMQWTGACIARAEALDQWTGRLDWTVRWLERVKEQGLYESTDARPLSRALRNAHVLESMVESGQHVGVSLSEINGLSQTDFVDWVMHECCARPELFPGLETVSGYIPEDAELRSAWNTWWSQNMLVAPQGLMAALIQSHKTCFDYSVVLAAIYSVGGPCSSFNGAKLLLEAIAPALGVRGPDSGVFFEQPIYEMLENSSASEVRDALRAISDDRVATVVGVGLAQVRAAETLNWFGLDVDIPTVMSCQGSASEQRRLLLRLLASAERHQDARADELSLWSSLQQLYQMGLFSQLSLDDVKREYLRMLLNSEKFEEARLLVDAEPLFTDGAAVRQTACEAARELFDNANMCSMDKGAMKAARQCLDIVPDSQQQDSDVKRERALIEAAHLVWTLGASVLPFFQSHRAVMAEATKTTGSGIHPIEIRLAHDPYVLLKRVLDSYSGAYKKQRIVREIAGKLFEIAGFPATGDSSPDPDHGNSTRRDLGVRSISEGFVAAIMLQSAVDAGDYSEAYNFARQLVNARPILSKALRNVEAHRSAKLLVDGDGADSRQPVEVRAIEAIWTSSVNLARAWSAEGGAAVVEKQLEVVSLALSLCPTSDIAELLRLWNTIQLKTVGDDGQSAFANAPWELSASNCSDPVERVRRVLIGCPPSASKDSAKSDVQAVSSESMRTFDPAIIKRCLRLASASQPLAGSAKLDQRCSLLMTWLEFSLTTAKEPTSDTDMEYRRKVESAIVRRYPQAACETLATRVLPQIDSTNYEALEKFYALYARCLEASGNGSGSGQALVRVGTIQSVKQSAVLREIAFAQLVHAVTAPKTACRSILGS
ncbi:hypothetical protein GGI21_002168, partial [Coemansia aciculifera]